MHNHIPYYAAKVLGKEKKIIISLNGKVINQS